MKQYFLSMMEDAWFRHPRYECVGDVCMGNHAVIHEFLNKINPMLTEHFDRALEGLLEKESAFINVRGFEFCLTRLA